MRDACAALALALVGCAGAAPPAPAAPRPKPAPAPLVAAVIKPVDDRAAIDREAGARVGARLDLSQPWKATIWGAWYLASDDAVAKDGGVDVYVHFHGAQVVNDEWRAAGVRGVVVAVTLPGYGVTPYRDMFAIPDRFGAIIDDAVKRVGGTHVRRLALLSWSAGYGATQDVLANAHYYAMTDTVVLFDGLHADYVEGVPDERDIAIFERFAHDAIHGEKQMVVTHSAVQPPGYASTTETATMLLAFVGCARVEEKRTNPRAMLEWYHADCSGLHVRGYRGDGPHDHMDQVHLLGDVVRTYVVPRWARMEVVDERNASRETASAKGG